MHPKTNDNTLYKWNWKRKRRSGVRGNTYGFGSKKRLHNNTF